VQHSVAWWQSQ